MKTYIKKVNDTTYKCIDDGKDVKCTLRPNAKGGAELAIGDNSMNVHFLKIKKFNELAKDGVYELTMNTRTPRTLGPKSSQGTKTTRTFAWPEYLTEDERKVYEDLKAKALKRADDPKEQLRRQIEALQAKLAEMDKE